MKLTALAVTAMLIAGPALAQGYGADTSSNPNAAVPATPATPSANSNDDTRVASNQAKHRQHKKSSASTQDQMSTSPAQASPDTSSTPPAPTPQQ